MTSIGQLGERLRSQIQQDQEAIERQTRDALMKHAESLKRLSSDALNTTRSAIKSESDLLAKSLAGVRKQAEAHIAKLPQMIWIAMLWPLLLTVALCMLAVIGTWIYLPTALFGAKTETWKLNGGKTATVIISQGWTVCTDNNNRQLPCRINP